MARSLRIEKENGVYHIINRGNYRQDLFINEGAHTSFENCLFEACEKCGWVLEGFCVMTNHFHLVVRTPKGNLIYGMKWLQSTFANRYHQFRKVHGKLFQGRYKSLIVEEDSHLGALLHYVHLNPVRAGMVTIDELKHYRWSSYWYLFNKRKRPPFLDSTGALIGSGGLADTPKGRMQYEDYLRWLSTDNAAQKEFAFEKMCRGWAIGTKDFKKALLKELEKSDDVDNEDNTSERDTILRYDGASLREANELQWELLLEKGLSVLEKNAEALVNDKKSEAWKVLLATLLKQKSSATNVWITQKLNMGTSDAVSRYVSEFKHSRGHEKKAYKSLITKVMT
ncbi:MAG: transposase [Verrucomicrobiota bacterium]